MASSGFISSKTDSRKSSLVLLVMNVTFAALAIFGQVAQNVSLPLWTGATSALDNPNCTESRQHNSSSDFYYGEEYEDPSNHSNDGGSSDLMMDPFFVLSFASLSFVVIFGVITLGIVLTQVIANAVAGKVVLKWITLEDDLLFPQWQLILIGIFDALNGAFVVFASMPKRTAPFLQAILGNFTIPLTIFFRLILLQKKPTLLKLLSAGAVLFGLLFSLIPVFSGMDADSKEGNKSYLDQSRRSQILWPLCFMFGFIPAAIMNVIEEKSLKDTRRVNLFFLLFWTSLYQLVTVWFLFWIDIIPGYGFAHNVKDFGQNYNFAIKCFFGGAGCSYRPGLVGTVFILMYVVSYLGGGLLLRYSEGATYLAVVQSLVTPLGAIFWSIFARDECANFSLSPHGGSLTYFSIAGIAIMVPAIFLYNIGTLEELKKAFRSILGHADSEDETKPLIKAPINTYNSNV